MMDESDDEDIDSVPETSLPSVDTKDSVSDPRDSLHL